MNRLSFKRFLNEQKISKEDFLKMLSDIYDLGDEALITKITNISSAVEIEEVIEKIFSERLTKADDGAKDTLISKIKKLEISEEEKVTFVKALENGTAYHILETVISSIKKPVSLDLLANEKVPGSKQMLPWLIEWDAKVNKKTRGKASSEIFFALAGKNGKGAEKGDVVVDGTKIELKSYGYAFASEFSIAGQQSSYKTPTANFRAKLKGVFEKHKIKVKDDSELGLNSETKSSVINLDRKRVSPLSVSLQKTVNLLHQAGMPFTEIDALFQTLIVNSFPHSSKKLTKFSVMNGPNINAHRFMVLWNAAAFEEYKHVEDFEVMVMINRKTHQMISFETGRDILALQDKIKTTSISYETGIGQNRSIGGFTFSG